MPCFFSFLLSENIFNTVTPVSSVNEITWKIILALPPSFFERSLDFNRCRNRSRARLKKKSQRTGYSDCYVFGTVIVPSRAFCSFSLGHCILSSAHRWQFVFTSSLFHLASSFECSLQEDRRQEEVRHSRPPQGEFANPSKRRYEYFQGNLNYGAGETRIISCNG